MSPILAAHLRLASNVRASIGHHGPTVITHFIRGNGRHPRPNAIAPVIATIGDIGSGNEIRLRKPQNGFGPDGAISVINMKIKKIRLPTLGGITVGCFKRDFVKNFSSSWLSFLFTFYRMDLKVLCWDKVKKAGYLTHTVSKLLELSRGSVDNEPIHAIKKSIR